MALDSQEKRMSVASGLPWMATPLPTGTIDVEERASIAALYTYAFAEAAVVEPTRSKRGIVPHISPPRAPYARTPTVPPRRRGLLPFRAKEGSMQEIRQSLQHLSAELGRVEQAVNWNVRVEFPVDGTEYRVEPNEALFFGKSVGGARRFVGDEGDQIAVIFPHPTPELRGVSCEVGWEFTPESTPIKLVPQSGVIEFGPDGQGAHYLQGELGHPHISPCKMTFVCVDEAEGAEPGWYAYQFRFGYPFG